MRARNTPGPDDNKNKKTDKVAASLDFVSVTPSAYRLASRRRDVTIDGKVMAKSRLAPSLRKSEEIKFAKKG